MSEERKKRALVVEDEPGMRRVVAAALDRSGFEAGQAADGAEALDALGRGRYDVVILDMMMPRVNGSQVIREMRSHGDGTPVLMLTALDDAEVVTDGLFDGADSYLAKPFRVSQLVQQARWLAGDADEPWTADEMTQG